MRTTTTRANAPGKRLSTRQIVFLALLVAILIALGMLNIPQPAGLSITFNMIPVAIAAIAMGPGGGAFMGGAFGILSFLQCFGIAGFSGMGAALAAVSPLWTFVQRFASRVLAGALTALVWRVARRRWGAGASASAAGFFAALFNTLFFMTSLVVIFHNTEYLTNLMAGRGWLAFIVASVGVNAVAEMAVCAVLTGAIVKALDKAGALRRLKG